MKKWTIIMALLALIVWGIYDMTSGSADVQVGDNEEIGQEDGEVGLEKGKLAPNFSVPGLDGEFIQLSDYYGKKVILNMWASWCPPCKEEMPHLQSYMDDHEDVVVLAINMTEAEKNKAVVTAFVNEHELTFPVALDERSAVADLYDVTTLPSSFFIDPEGRIQEGIIGPLSYGMLDEIMTELDREGAEDGGTR